MNLRTVVVIFFSATSFSFLFPQQTYAQRIEVATVLTEGTFDAEEFAVEGVITDARLANGDLDASMIGKPARCLCRKLPDGTVVDWWIFDNYAICTQNVPPPVLSPKNTGDLMFFANTFDVTENDVATLEELEQLLQDAIDSNFLGGDIAFVDTNQSPLIAELDALISAGGSRGLKMTLILGADPTTDLLGTVELTDAVPTISEWGLVVMTVLVLTAGTVVIGRRRRHAAA